MVKIVLSKMVDNFIKLFIDKIELNQTKKMLEIQNIFDKTKNK